MSTDETSEPAQKKLRSAEPDLRIILKYTPKKENSEENAVDGEHDTDDEDSDEEEEGQEKKAEKEYQFYSHVLAKHSKFIDTTLSVDMQEKTTQTILFQDVEPETFELALLFLEDPREARKAGPEDVIKVAEFYDKYEFTLGISFVDSVLTAYFVEEEKSEKAPKDLALLVDAVSLVHRLQLGEDAMETGADCMDSLTRPRIFSTKGPIMFTPDMVKQLQPLFEEKKIRLPRKIVVSDDEMASSLFPKYFVDCMATENCGRPSTFRIHFAGKGLEQTFKWSRSREAWVSTKKKRIVLDDMKACVRLERIDVDKLYENDLTNEKHGDWAIVVHFEDEHDDDEDDDDYSPLAVFWYPYSSHLATPPTGNWQSVKCLSSSAADELGLPTLTYWHSS